MIALEELVEFIEKYDTTTSDVVFLLLVHTRQHNLDLAQRYVNVFFKDGHPKILRDNLVKKGLLKELNKNPTDLMHYSTTKYCQEVFIDMYNDANEFMNLYPSFIQSDKGVELPLKLVDLNAFRKLYAEKAKYSKKQHHKIIEALQYAIDNNMINMKIDKFLSSEYYNIILDMMNKDRSIESLDNNFGE